MNCSDCMHNSSIACLLGALPEPCLALDMVLSCLRQVSDGPPNTNIASICLHKNLKGMRLANRDSEIRLAFSQHVKIISK